LFSSSGRQIFPFSPLNGFMGFFPFEIGRPSPPKKGGAPDFFPVLEEPFLFLGLFFQGSPFQDKGSSPAPFQSPKLCPSLLNGRLNTNFSFFFPGLPCSGGGCPLFGDTVYFVPPFFGVDFRRGGGLFFFPFFFARFCFFS